MENQVITFLNIKTIKKKALFTTTFFQIFLTKTNVVITYLVSSIPSNLTEFEKHFTPFFS